MRIYVIVFWEFFKIGLFAVGGGPSTIPYLIELTKRYDWFTMTEFTNMIAISESTPGPIGLNMATYAGYHAAGILGGLIASLGLVCPSIIIVVIIAKFLSNFSENPYVKAAFAGIRPAVTALIAVAIYNLCTVSLFVEKAGEKTLALKTVLLMIAVFLLMQVKKLQKLHPVVWIAGAAVIGIIFKF